MQHYDPESTTVFAVTSGKGGVGKTTISLALALELNTAKNGVVLIDCDLSNRGLSELVSVNCKPTTLTLRPPGLFTPDNSDPVAHWRILELRPRLTTVEIPPLDPTTIILLESQPFSAIQQAISDLTIDAIEKTGATVAILDCHGGRDVFSFAAAALSKHLIVVSVPETITFFGTIQFMQGFRDYCAEEESIVREPKRHVLLNNVLDGFSHSLLSYWYREHFEKHFDDNDFLSVIPFDPKISIATSDELFPTRKFYYSSMAERIRIMTIDMCGDMNGFLISKEAQFASRVMRPIMWVRETVLETVTDHKIPLHLLVFNALTFFCAILAQELLDSPIDIKHIMAISAFWMQYSFIWFVCAFVSRSIINHDALACSELSRQSWGNWFRAAYRSACVLFGILSIILVYAFILFFDVDDAKGLFEITGSMERIFVIVIYALQMVTILSTLPFFLVFIIRGIRTIKFRIRSVEALYRGLVTTLVAGTTVLLWDEFIQLLS